MVVRAADEAGARDAAREAESPCSCGASGTIGMIIEWLGPRTVPGGRPEVA